MSTNARKILPEFYRSLVHTCSQICPLKLNLRPQVGLTYGIYFHFFFFFFFFFFFLNFRLRKYLLRFFAEFEFWMFHSNLVKISEKIKKTELVENLPA